MSKDVTVIIPVLNEEAALDKLLPALWKLQNGNVKEILVVDGGSSDTSRQVARKHQARVLSAPKKGRAIQMNFGAKNAGTNILYFLHADTTPLSDFDSAIIGQIHKGADAGCFRLRFDDAHPALKFYAWFTRFPSTLLRFGDQSLFVKKELFEKIGGFDESLIVMEDQKIVRECKKHGRFDLLPQPVVTSARKYRKNGVLRLQFIFTLIWSLYYLGVKQNTLAHLYRILVKF